jgi:hypothetical protein
VKARISKLESRIDKLESHGKILEGKPGDASPVTKTVSAAPATKPAEVDEDDSVDLFGSDSEVCVMCK